jgi:hypothetical protein
VEYIRDYGCKQPIIGFKILEPKVLGEESSLKMHDI